MAKELEDLLAAHPELGYGKTNNAVNEAVRRFVRELRREIAERDPKARWSSDDDLPTLDEVVTMLRRKAREEQKKSPSGKRPKPVQE